MKVIFLLPTLSVGGGERVASELSLGLPKNIEKVIVLFKKDISYLYEGRVISLDVLTSGNIVKKVINCFLGLLKFRKLVKAENPDYVVSFGHLPNLINIFSNSKAILRIDNFYSSSCQSFGGRLYKVLVKIFFNKAFIIMPVSKESAKDLIKNFKIKKQKIKVIYNPLNIQEIQRLSKEPLEKEFQGIFKNPVVVNMGQLGKQKNQQDLIKVFKKIKLNPSPGGKDAKLVILGQGSFELKLKELAKKFGLENDVHFLGWQKNPFKFLANSKVFALSSLWEGLPYVLLEAMACGLPVVSYDCKSGPREILAPNTGSSFQTKDIERAEFGILTEPKNIEQLAKAIKKVLCDADLANELKEKSKKRAAEFDVKNIIKQWNFLYEQVN